MVDWNKIQELHRTAFYLPVRISIELNAHSVLWVTIRLDRGKPECCNFPSEADFSETFTSVSAALEYLKALESAFQGGFGIPKKDGFKQGLILRKVWSRKDG